MLKWPFVLAGLAICISGAKCDEYQAPKVTFRDVDLVNVNAEGMTIDFEIEVYNPNPVAAPLEQAEYVVRIGRAEVLKGRASPGGTLPANGTLPISLPVRLTWQNILAAEETIRHLGGDVPYSFDGKLWFDVRQIRPGQPAAIEMHYTGTLPIRQLLRDPGLLLRSSAVRRLAEIVLDQVFNRPAEPTPEALPEQ